jgi:hypothetical protein
MDNKIYNETIFASQGHNIEGVKKGLKKLNLIKTFNPFKDIYARFKKLGNDYHDSYLIESTQHQLMSSLLVNAASFGDIDFCKYLIQSKELKVNADLNNENIWSQLIHIGNLDVINALLTINVDSPLHRAGKICSALNYGRELPKLNILEYFIDDLSMPFHIELNLKLKDLSSYHTRTKDYSLPNICQIFISNCQRNNKEGIDFILQHKEYGKMIDSFTFFEGIKVACRPETYKMMEYLLNDEKMPFKVYQDYDPTRLLQIAARYNREEILHYLVFDFNIQKPKNFFMAFDVGPISHHVVSFKDQAEIDAFNERVIKLNDLFEKRDLHNELQSDLKENKNNLKVKRKL